MLSTGFRELIGQDGMFRATAINAKGII